MTVSTKKEVLANEALKSAISNEEFVQLTHEIINSEEKEPPYDKEDYINFTQVNLRRYEGFSKKVELSDEIVKAVSSGKENWKFVLLNEPWCSDGSFSQPVIQKIAEASDGAIELKILLRDKHPEVMDRFLTNGGKSIPKLVILNQANEVMGTWGPRPNELQTQVIEMANNPDATLEDKIKLTNRWYNKDKGNALQMELIQILQEIQATN